MCVIRKVMQTLHNLRVTRKKFLNDDVDHHCKVICEKWRNIPFSLINTISKITWFTCTVHLKIKLRLSFRCSDNSRTL